MKHLSTASTSLLAAVLGLGLSAAAAQERSTGYVYDASGQPTRDASGDCVRTGFWATDLATIECDPHLVKKPEPVPVVAAPPEPAPPPAPPLAAFERVMLEATTLFDFDSDRIRPEGTERLDELIADLKEFPRVGTVSIVGHTDSTGPAEYNEGLAERRANAVREYMIQQGIEADRIEALGRGEAEPIATNETREGRQLNRRVEIEIPVERQVQR
jgi:OmpA-OmpF porin, OOP family